MGEGGAAPSSQDWTWNLTMKCAARGTQSCDSGLKVATGADGGRSASVRRRLLGAQAARGAAAQEHRPVAWHTRQLRVLFHFLTFRLTVSLFHFQLFLATV